MCCMIQKVILLAFSIMMFQLTFGQTGNKNVNVTKKLLCKTWILKTTVTDGIENPPTAPGKSDEFTLREDNRFINDCLTCDNNQTGAWKLVGKDGMNLMVDGTSEVIKLKILKLTENRLEVKLLDQIAESLVYFDSAKR